MKLRSRRISMQHPIVSVGVLPEVDSPIDDWPARETTTIQGSQFWRSCRYGYIQREQFPTNHQSYLGLRPMSHQNAVGMISQAKRAGQMHIKGLDTTDPKLSTNYPVSMLQAIKHFVDLSSRFSTRIAPTSILARNHLQCHRPNESNAPEVGWQRSKGF